MPGVHNPPECATATYPAVPIDFQVAPCTSDVQHVYGCQCITPFSLQNNCTGSDRLWFIVNLTSTWNSLGIVYSWLYQWSGIIIIGKSTKKNMWCVDTRTHVVNHWCKNHCFILIMSTWNSVGTAGYEGVAHSAGYVLLMPGYYTSVFTSWPCSFLISLVKLGYAKATQ